MATMRDLSQVEDIKLGCLFQPDEKNFAAAPVIQDRKLKKRIWRLDTLRNQGNTSMCTAYFMSHELTATPVVINPIPDSFIRNMYCEAQKIDPWEGDECGGSPAYGGTSMLAIVKVAHKLKFFEEYRWASTAEEVAKAIAYYGPVGLGIRWYSDMSRPDVNNFIHPTGTLQGGHAICAIGVDPEKEMFILANSWGTNWGDKGYCYLSFKDLNTLFQQNAEAVFFLRRKFRQIK